jgi:hypothetical protein
MSNKTYCLNANYQQFMAIRLTLSPPIMTLGDPGWRLRTRQEPFEGTERRKEVTLIWLGELYHSCVHFSEEVKEVNIWVIFNHLKPSGNFKKFYVLPTQCVYVFCMDLRKNSDCFPIQLVSSCWVKVNSPLPRLSAVKNGPTTQNYFNWHTLLP